MKSTRRIFNSKFKAQVALEALKERLTVSEIAQKHQISVTQVRAWKKAFESQASSVFDSPDRRAEEKLIQERDSLYQEIGQREVEIGWLKKKLKC